MKRAVLSMLRGETHAQYLGAVAPAPLKVNNMILIHKTVNNVTTFATVSATGWDEINGSVPDSEIANTANALASVMADSKSVPADRYDRAKAWWLANVVPNVNGMTQTQADAMAEQVAQAVIAADTNELTEEDLDNVTEAVKEAFRQGTGA
jgi:uncharacterized protein (DUF2267 family)